MKTEEQLRLVKLGIDESIIADPTTDPSVLKHAKALSDFISFLLDEPNGFGPTWDAIKHRHGQAADTVTE